MSVDFNFPEAPAYFHVVCVVGLRLSIVQFFMSSAFTCAYKCK